jgi:hypothetical protein
MGVAKVATNQKWLFKKRCETGVSQARRDRHVPLPSERPRLPSGHRHQYLPIKAQDLALIAGENTFAWHSNQFILPA